MQELHCAHVNLRTLETQLKRVGKRSRETQEERDRLIREAAAGGLSRRKIGELVGISYARVHQIIREKSEAGNV